MSDVPDLATAQETKEILEITDGEYADLIEDGSLRRVQFADGARILGCDIDRALKDQDPRHLARLVLDGADPEDPESPKNLAADMPRL